MHENFIALEEEKRDRIINAALEEFAAKGYKNASTNVIVKKAGISKGALFHYFSSKKDLFEFLFLYSVDVFINMSEPRIKKMSADVFERWLDYAALKIEIALQYPGMAGFMRCVYREDAWHTNEVIRKGYLRFSSVIQSKIHEGLDTGRFQEGIDPARAMQMIRWVLEGFANDMQRNDNSIAATENAEFIESLIEDMKGYFRLLKSALYKEEYRD